MASIMDEFDDFFRETEIKIDYKILEGSFCLCFRLVVNRNFEGEVFLMVKVKVFVMTKMVLF